MADLINKNDISFRCSYGGECMAEIEDCKVCVHYVCDYEDVQNVAVIAEQEIRNIAIDEFAERLKERIVGMQMAELQGEDICPCAENSKECPYINQDIGCQYCAREHTIKEIDEIAEQMKAGGMNE